MWSITNAGYAGLFSLRISGWRESPAAWLSFWSLGLMKSTCALASLGLLLAAGCRSKDELALQPYKNIPPGSVIVLQTKTNVTDGTRLPARKFDVILTNGCALEGIRDDTVSVSNFNGTRLSFAGSMVTSIGVRKTPTPPQDKIPKP